MIVPEYWAEAKLKTHVKGKQVTIKRYGWSDVSESDALKNAQERTEDAIKQVEAGESVRRIDHKIPYNGGEGLPIREEIVSRHDDAVITRNIYGALCINTPDVMFADIDIPHEPSKYLYVFSFVILILTTIVIGIYGGISGWVYLLFAFLSLIFTSALANAFYIMTHFFKGRKEQKALSKIRIISARYPKWQLRVYRTPMGYRILVMHKTFDPTDDESIKFLQNFGSDPLYVLMCKNQHCFRARVSPKPWRIGMKRLGPNPGIWPIKSERMPERQQWIKEYEKKSENYASCKFIEKLGSGNPDIKAEYIQRIHDELCKVNSTLNIA